MKAFAALSFFVTLAAQVAALTINTPASLVQCEPAQITWTSDGTAPYFLTVIPGGQVSASPLKEFAQTSDTSVTWTVDLASGTSVTLALRDSTGNQVFTQAVTIQSSSISSCVNTSLDENSTASGSGTTAASGSTTVSATSGVSTTVASTTTSTSAAGGTVTSGTTTAASGTTTKPATTSTGSASKTTTSTAATTSSNAALRGSAVNSFGVAGLLGLVGAALL